MKPFNIRNKSTSISNLPIGEFLQRVNALDPKTAQKVLKLQKKYPSKTFGQIAIERGYVKDDLTRKYLTLKGFF